MFEYNGLFTSKKSQINMSLVKQTFCLTSVCVFALGYDDRDDVDDDDDEDHDDDDDEDHDDGDGDGDGDDHFLRLARFHVGRPILKF